MAGVCSTSPRIRDSSHSMSKSESSRQTRNSSALLTLALSMGLLRNLGDVQPSLTVEGESGILRPPLEQLAGRDRSLLDAVQVAVEVVCRLEVRDGIGPL